MKTKLLYSSFFFQTDVGEIEVRATGTRKEPDFAIFLNGNYKESYCRKVNANKSNAEDIVKHFIEMSKCTGVHG